MVPKVEKKIKRNEIMGFFIVIQGKQCSVIDAVIEVKEDFYVPILVIFVYCSMMKIWG